MLESCNINEMEYEIKDGITALFLIPTMILWFIACSISANLYSEVEELDCNIVSCELLDLPSPWNCG